MQQSKVSKSLSSRRPRSVDRPRSAGNTRTKSYFDTREGKTTGKEENVDVVGPSFLYSNDETFPPTICGDNDDDRILQLPLLGNFDSDSDLFEWEITRTIKPRNAFGYNLQVHCDDTARRNCEMTTTSEKIRTNDKSVALETYWLAARHPIHVFLVVWKFIVTYLLTCCSIMTRFMKNRNDNSIRQINKDGLVADSLLLAPVLSASNRVRVEDRIRRELNLEGKIQKRQSENGDQELAAPSHDIDSTAVSDVVIMDKSYWTIPGQDLVSPKRRSENVPSEVEVTIDIGQIKFSHNQVFTAQEKKLASVSCLYDQYRLQMEANTFRTSVLKVTETCQQIRSIHEDGVTSGKVSGDSRSVLKSLLNDLHSSTNSLVTESESIKNISQQMKQRWNEFLRTRDDMDSYYADVVLKSSLPCSELNTDLKKLAEEMKCTKPVLSRIGDDESSVNSSRLLQDLESNFLSDTNHIAEVIELIQPSPKRDFGKLRFKKADKYFARLLLNNHVVGDTETEQLDRRSFSVRLSHRFNCRLLQKPTDTCVQIWKASTGFLPDELICNCFFIIQGASEVSNSSNAETCQGRTRLSHGDWLQFASENSDVKGMIWLATRAIERADKRPSLAVRVSNIPMYYLPHQTRLIRLGGFDSYLNMSTQSKPHIRSCPDMQSAMEFKHSNGILFSNKMIFEEPLRHVLIKKRRENNSLGQSHIPITELEVQGSDAFHDMINSDIDLNEESVVHDAINERPHVDKLSIMELFRRVREYSQRTCARKYHFSEVIQDVSIYRTFPQLLSLTFPPAKRSLYPKSAHFLPVISRTQSWSLLLTVIGGINVPRKLEAIAVEEEVKTNTVGHRLPKEDKETGVGVIVKIRCRGKLYQTNVANCGTSNPQWKARFCIPLCDELEDIFASDLSDEMVHFSLYDSTAVDLKNIGGFYEDEDSLHFELRYLGRASFPIGIALREGEVNGFIHCQSPFCVIGYIKGNGGANENSAVDCSSQLYCDPMIHVHMTTEPFTVIPPRNRMELPSIETEFILSRLTKWAQNHLDVGSVLWPDSVGCSNIASRFLTEQAPPPGFNTLTSCANFVSLIPSIHLVNWKALKGRDNDMTLTSQQFINILVGTRREHAILLTNFFLYLSNSEPGLTAEVLLVIGFSIPEGVTTFVLRRCRKTREVLVWDAMTGRAYPQPDNSCPLQKILCLVSPNNMYRNAEPDKTLSLLDLDISNVRKWAPLHNINEESKFARFTVQDERLQFALPDHQRAKETQINVCESIQSSIRGWRHTATCFRPDISAKMALKLEQLENAKLDGLPTSNVEMSLNERMMQSRMTGFILHEPFNSVQDILDTIKASEIHRNRNPHVEYVVSVRAFAYPGGVSSVWVCVCLVRES